MSLISRAALAAGAVSLTVLTTACEGSGQAEAVVPSAPEVATTGASGTLFQLTDDLLGRVAPIRAAEIRPQVGGIIQNRLFTEGALVQAGEPLFRINAAPFLADVESAEAALAQVVAARDNARLQVERLTPLVEINAVSRQVFDNAVADLAQSEAAVGVARASLTRRRLDLEFATITAPISGRIGAASVTEGALVSASGGDALAIVQQIDQVYVDVSQPASRLDALRTMGGQTGGAVELLDADGRPLGLTGQLLFSEVSVDPGTGDVRTRILVDNASGRLLPGMVVRARLPRGPEQSLPRVPQQAVTFVGGAPQVIVVGEGGLTEVRRIEVGDVIDNQYVVLAGLNVGEQVVVEGRSRVLPGMPVRTVPWASSSRVSANTP